MSIFEYNEEEELKKLREGEHQTGKEEGIAEGEIKGEIKGRAKGFAESCLFTLESHGTVPEWLKRRILEETAPEAVKAWMQAAVTTGSVEAFLEKTGLKASENE